MNANTISATRLSFGTNTILALLGLGMVCVCAGRAQTYNLNVDTNSPVYGTVQPDPDLPGRNYPANAEVILTANPNNGYYFVIWSGDAHGTNSQTTVIMDADKRVIATFANQPVDLPLSFPAMLLTCVAVAAVALLRLHGPISLFGKRKSVRR